MKSLTQQALNKCLFLPPFPDCSAFSPSPGAQYPQGCPSTGMRPLRFLSIYLRVCREGREQRKGAYPHLPCFYVLQSPQGLLFPHSASAHQPLLGPGQVPYAC